MKKQALSKTQRSHFFLNPNLRYVVMNCEKKKCRKACRIQAESGSTVKQRDFIESLSNTTNRNEASELAKTNVKLTK